MSSFGADPSAKREALLRPSLIQLRPAPIMDSNATAVSHNKSLCTARARAAVRQAGNGTIKDSEAAFALPVSAKGLAQPHPAKDNSIRGDLYLVSPSGGGVLRHSSGCPNWVVCEEGRLSVYSSYSHQAQLVEEAQFDRLTLLFNFSTSERGNAVPLHQPGGSVSLPGGPQWTSTSAGIGGNMSEGGGDIRSTASFSKRHAQRVIASKIDQAVYTRTHSSPAYLQAGGSASDGPPQSQSSHPTTTSATTTRQYFFGVDCMKAIPVVSTTSGTETTTLQHKLLIFSTSLVEDYHEWLAFLDELSLCTTQKFMGSNRRSASAGARSPSPSNLQPPLEVAEKRSHVDYTEVDQMGHPVGSRTYDPWGAKFVGSDTVVGLQKFNLNDTKAFVELLPSEKILEPLPDQTELRLAFDEARAWEDRYHDTMLQRSRELLEHEALLREMIDEVQTATRSMWTAAASLQLLETTSTLWSNARLKGRLILSPALSSSVKGSTPKTSGMVTTSPPPLLLSPSLRAATPEGAGSGTDEHAGLDELRIRLEAFVTDHNASTTSLYSMLQEQNQQLLERDESIRIIAQQNEQLTAELDRLRCDVCDLVREHKAAEDEARRLAVDALKQFTPVATKVDASEQSTEVETAPRVRRTAAGRLEGYALLLEKVVKRVVSATAFGVERTRASLSPRHNSSHHSFRRHNSPRIRRQRQTLNSAKDIVTTPTVPGSECPDYQVPRTDELSTPGENESHTAGYCNEQISHQSDSQCSKGSPSPDAAIDDQEGPRLSRTDDDSLSSTRVQLLEDLTAQGDAHVAEMEAIEAQRDAALLRSVQLDEELAALRRQFDEHAAELSEVRSELMINFAASNSDWLQQVAFKDTEIASLRERIDQLQAEAERSEAAHQESLASKEATLYLKIQRLQRFVASKDHNFAVVMGTMSECFESYRSLTEECIGAWTDLFGNAKGDALRLTQTVVMETMSECFEGYRSLTEECVCAWTDLFRRERDDALRLTHADGASMEYKWNTTATELRQKLQSTEVAFQAHIENSERDHANEILAIRRDIAVLEDKHSRCLAQLEEARNEESNLRLAIDVHVKRGEHQDSVIQQLEAALQRIEDDAMFSSTFNSTGRFGADETVTTTESTATSPIPQEEVTSSKPSPFRDTSKEASPQSQAGDVSTICQPELHLPTFESLITTPLEREEPRTPCAMEELPFEQHAPACEPPRAHDDTDEPSWEHNGVFQKHEIEALQIQTVSSMYLDDTLDHVDHLDSGTNASSREHSGHRSSRGLRHVHTHSVAQALLKHRERLLRSPIDPLPERATPRSGKAQVNPKLRFALSHHSASLRLRKYEVSPLPEALAPPTPHARTPRVSAAAIRKRYHKAMQQLHAAVAIPSGAHSAETIVVADVAAQHEAEPLASAVPAQVPPCSSEEKRPATDIPDPAIQIERPVEEDSSPSKSVAIASASVTVEHALKEMEEASINQADRAQGRVRQLQDSLRQERIANASLLRLLHELAQHMQSKENEMQNRVSDLRETLAASPTPSLSASLMGHALHNTAATFADVVLEPHVSEGGLKQSHLAAVRNVADQYSALLEIAEMLERTINVAEREIDTQHAAKQREARELRRERDRVEREMQAAIRRAEAEKSSAAHEAAVAREQLELKQEEHRQREAEAAERARLEAEVNLQERFADELRKREVSTRAILESEKKKLELEREKVLKDLELVVAAKLNASEADQQSALQRLENDLRQTAAAASEQLSQKESEMRLAAQSFERELAERERLHKDALAAQQEALRHLDRELSEHKLHERELSRTVSGLEQEIERAKRQAEEAERLKIALCNEALEKKEALEEKMREVEMQHQLDAQSLKSKIRLMKQERDMFEQQCKALKDQMNSLEDELTQRQKKREEEFLEAKMKREKQLFELQVAMSELSSEREREAEELRSKMKELEAARKAQTERAAGMERKVSELSEILSKKESTMLEVSGELDDTKNTLKRTVSDLSAEVSQLTNKSTEADARRQQELAELQRQHAMQVAAIEREKQSDIERKSADAEGMKAMIRQLISERDVAVKQLNDLQEEVKGFEASKEILTKQNEALSQRLKRCIQFGDEEKSLLEQRARLGDEEVEGVRAKYFALLVERDAMNSAMDHLYDLILQVRCAVDDGNTSFLQPVPSDPPSPAGEKLQRLVAASSDHVECVKDSIRRIKGQLTQHKKIVGRDQQELQELRRQKIELERTQQEVELRLDEARQQHQSESLALRVAQEHGEQQRQALQRTLDEQTAMVAKWQSDYAALRQRFEDSEAAHAGEVSALQAAHAGEVSALQAAHAGEVSALQADAALMRSTSGAAMDEQKRLEEKIAQLELSLRALERKAAESSQSYENELRVAQNRLVQQYEEHQQAAAQHAVVVSELKAHHEKLSDAVAALEESRQTLVYKQEELQEKSKALVVMEGKLHESTEEALRLAAESLSQQQLFEATRQSLLAEHDDARDAMLTAGALLIDEMETATRMTMEELARDYFQAVLDGHHSCRSAMLSALDLHVSTNCFASHIVGYLSSHVEDAVHPWMASMSQVVTGLMGSHLQLQKHMHTSVSGALLALGVEDDALTAMLDDREGGSPAAYCETETGRLIDLLLKECFRRRNMVIELQKMLSDLQSSSLLSQSAISCNDSAAAEPLSRVGDIRPIGDGAEECPVTAATQTQSSGRTRRMSLTRGSEWAAARRLQSIATETLPLSSFVAFTDDGTQSTPPPCGVVPADTKANAVDLSFDGDSITMTESLFVERDAMCPQSSVVDLEPVSLQQPEDAIEELKKKLKLLEELMSEQRFVEAQLRRALLGQLHQDEGSPPADTSPPEETTPRSPTIGDGDATIERHNDDKPPSEDISNENISVPNDSTAGAMAEEENRAASLRRRGPAPERRSKPAAVQPPTHAAAVKVLPDYGHHRRSMSDDSSAQSQRYDSGDVLQSSKTDSAAPHRSERRITFLDEQDADASPHSNSTSMPFPSLASSGGSAHHHRVYSTEEEVITETVEVESVERRPLRRRANTVQGAALSDAIGHRLTKRRSSHGLPSKGSAMEGSSVSQCTEMVVNALREREEDTNVLASAVHEAIRYLSMLTLEDIEGAAHRFFDVASPPLDHSTSWKPNDVAVNPRLVLEVEVPKLIAQCRHIAQVTAQLRNLVESDDTKKRNLGTDSSDEDGDEATTDSSGAQRAPAAAAVSDTLMVPGDDPHSPPALRATTTNSASLSSPKGRQRQGSVVRQFSISLDEILDSVESKFDELQHLRIEHSKVLNDLRSMLHHESTSNVFDAKPDDEDSAPDSTLLEGRMPAAFENAALPVFVPLNPNGPAEVELMEPPAQMVENIESEGPTSPHNDSGMRSPAMSQEQVHVAAERHLSNPHIHVSGVHTDSEGECLTAGSISLTSRTLTGTVTRRGPAAPKKKPVALSGTVHTENVSLKKSDILLSASPGRRASSAGGSVVISQEEADASSTASKLSSPPKTLQLDGPPPPPSAIPPSLPPSVGLPKALSPSPGAKPGTPSSTQVYPTRGTDLVSVVKKQLATKVGEVHQLRTAIKTGIEALGGDVHDVNDAAYDNDDASADAPRALNIASQLTTTLVSLCKETGESITAVREVLDPTGAQGTRVRLATLVDNIKSKVVELEEVKEHSKQLAEEVRLSMEDTMNSSTSSTLSSTGATSEPAVKKQLLKKAKPKSITLAGTVGGGGKSLKKTIDFSQLPKPVMVVAKEASLAPPVTTAPSTDVNPAAVDLTPPAPLQIVDHPLSSSPSPRHEAKIASPEQHTLQVGAEVSLAPVKVTPRETPQQRDVSPSQPKPAAVNPMEELRNELKSRLHEVKELRLTVKSCYDFLSDALGEHTMRQINKAAYNAATDAARERGIEDDASRLAKMISSEATQRTAREASIQLKAVFRVIEQIASTLPVAQTFKQQQEAAAAAVAAATTTTTATATTQKPHDTALSTSVEGEPLQLRSTASFFYKAMSSPKLEGPSSSETFGTSPAIESQVEPMRAAAAAPPSVAPSPTNVSLPPIADLVTSLVAEYKKAKANLQTEKDNAQRQVQFLIQQHDREMKEMMSAGEGLEKALMYQQTQISGVDSLVETYLLCNGELEDEFYTAMRFQTTVVLSQWESIASSNMEDLDATRGEAASLSTTVELLTDKLHTLMARNEELTEGNRALEETLEELQTAYSELQASLKELNQQQATRLTEIESLRVMVDTTARENISLQERVAAKDQEHKVALDLLNTCKVDLQDERSRNELLSLDKDKLMAEYEKVSASLSETRLQSGAQQEKLLTTSTKLMGLAIEAAEAKERLKKAERALELHEEEAKVKQGKVERELELREASWTEKVDTLTALLETTKQQWNEDVRIDQETYQRSLNNIQALVSEKEAVVARLSMELETVRTESDVLREQHATLTRGAESLQASNKQLEAQATVTAAEVKKLKSRIGDLDIQLAYGKDHVTQIEKAAIQMRQKLEREWQQKVQVEIDSHANTKQQLSQSSAAIEAHQRETKALREEMARRIQAAEEENATLTEAAAAGVLRLQSLAEKQLQELIVSEAHCRDLIQAAVDDSLLPVGRLLKSALEALMDCGETSQSAETLRQRIIDAESAIQSLKQQRDLLVDEVESLRASSLVAEKTLEARHKDYATALHVIQQEKQERTDAFAILSSMLQIDPHRSNDESELADLLTESRDQGNQDRKSSYSKYHYEDPRFKVGDLSHVQQCAEVRMDDLRLLARTLSRERGEVIRCIQLLSLTSDEFSSESDKVDTSELVMATAAHILPSVCERFVRIVVRMHDECLSLTSQLAQSDDALRAATSTVQSLQQWSTLVEENVLGPLSTWRSQAKLQVHSGSAQGLRHAHANAMHHMNEGDMVQLLASPPPKAPRASVSSAPAMAESQSEWLVQTRQFISEIIYQWRVKESLEDELLATRRLLEGCLARHHPTQQWNTQAVRELATAVTAVLEGSVNQRNTLAAEWHKGQEALRLAQSSLESLEHQHSSDIQFATIKIGELRQHVLRKRLADSATEQHVTEVESSLEHHTREVVELSKEKAQVGEHIRNIRSLLHQKRRWDDETNLMIRDLQQWKGNQF